MITADLLDEIAAIAAAIIALPPRPRPLLEFACSLRLPDGPQVGESYDPRSHPACFEILRAFAAGGLGQMVVIGPVQDGKSWSTITVPMLYMLAELRRPVILGLPDRSLAAKYWRSKLKPTIQGCGLAHLLPSDGPGSDGGAPEDVLLSSGARLYLLGAGARNEAGQSMVTGQAVFVDERDSIRSRWVELLFARAEAYDTLKRLVSTSTIKSDTESTTWSTYQVSLGYRLWFACPHCVANAHPTGGWQTFDPERFAYDGADDNAAAASAHIACKHDAEHRITEEHRRRALASWRLVARGQAVDGAGNVAGDLPATRVWGMRWTALDSPLKSLPMLAVRHRQAVERREAYGDHEPLRQFYRDLWVQPYTGDVDAAEAVAVFGADYNQTRIYLAARSAAHGWAALVDDKDEAGLYSRHRAPIPAEATMGVLAIDVQQNRCYWAAFAADADMRTWDVAHGYEYATHERQPTTEGELHAIFDRIRDDVMPHVFGDLPVIARGIDVGYQQGWIVPWLASNRDWLPVAGAGEEVAGKLREDRTQPLSGVVYVTRPEGWRLSSNQHLHTVDINRVKLQAQSGFLRAPGSAGAAHLPRGMKPNHTYIMHLCGELLQEDPRTGRKRWVKQTGRHDYLDLRTYADALLRLHLDKARRRAAIEAVTPDPQPSGGGGSVW